jgi:DNA-binding MarR family transcriptional regulator
MSEYKHTPAGRALTGLILELFRLNNRLLAAGDRLVAGIGLTSGRWKVMGTITAAERPQSVAWLARDMGGNRQNVQRIVNDLVNEGLLEYRSNPHHRRAQLVVLTAAGKQAFDDAMRLQVPWINALSDGLTDAEIEMTRKVMTALSGKLEGDGGPEQSE